MELDNVVTPETYTFLSIKIKKTLAYIHKRAFLLHFEKQSYPTRIILFFKSVIGLPRSSSGQRE